MIIVKSSKKNNLTLIKLLVACAEILLKISGMDVKSNNWKAMD